MLLRSILVASLILCLTASGAKAQSNTQSFSFVAIGDMPYGKPKKVYPKFERLIQAINAAKPAFTMHVGDTKSGSLPCSNDILNQQRHYMNTFDSAVVYTPGDNEWTDCHRGKAGNFDPIERLSYIRKAYFDRSQSLGAKPITVERQSDVFTEHATFVENMRFARNGVHFITAHVVGSNNNFEVRDSKAVMEFFRRDKANIAWLQSSFDKAIATEARAIVLAIHADMFQFGFNLFRRERHLRHSGYKNFTEMLVGKANEFDRPVLLIYGDTHEFRVFRPFKRTAKNITALEVFGAQNMHAVEVQVTPETTFPFAFKPILNPSQK